MIRKIILRALVVLAILVAGVLILASMRPDTFRVARSTSIAAPPEKIFAILNDFRTAPSWSPYETRDPAMKRSYSGPESGLGAVYEFEGNRAVGAGRLEITQSTPNEKVTMTLDMVKPFDAHNLVEYTLEPQGDSTTVTWAMSGRSPFLAKVVSLFIDCDELVGKDFEAGLANLKALAEK